MGKNKEHRNDASSIERRYITSEARATSDGDAIRIGGLAAVYNKTANIGNYFLERIQPGFFDHCDMGDTVCLFNHDPNLVLGRVRSGTLEIRLAETGLDYTAMPPSARADVVELITRGDVYQSSFAFTILEERWEDVDPKTLVGQFSEKEIENLSRFGGGRVDVRILVRAAKLYDVSPATYPAYQEATVSSRSLKNLGAIHALREQGKKTKATTDHCQRLDLYMARRKKIEQTQKRLKNG